MSIKKLAICLLVILIVSGCSPQPTYETNSEYELGETSLTNSQIKDEGSSEEPPEEKEPDGYLLYTIDLSLPPADREWQTESIQADVETMTISNVMWVLRGERSFEDLPVVAEISDTYTINITDPSFMGNYNFLINACVTYFQGLGVNFYLSNSDPEITILYEEKLAGDLIQYPNGQLIVPYYESDTGIWLPDELRVLQDKIQRPIITERPHQEILGVEGGVDMSFLETLIETPQIEIIELLAPSNSIQKSIQGYLSAVLPKDVRKLDNVSFSEPSQAPDEFVFYAARQFAPHFTAKTIVEYDIMAPYVALYPSDAYYLFIDIETVAEEIFGVEVSIDDSHFSYGDVYISAGYGTVVYPRPVVLEYIDMGDRYEVNGAIAQYSGLASSWYIGKQEMEEPIHADDLVDAIFNRYPRFTATLMKHEQYGFQLYAFHYEEL